MQVTALTIIAAIVLSYVIGSIPTGYWLARALKGIDIREEGSGSTGATNVLRCVGKGPALFTLIFDLLKGYVTVAGTIQLESMQHWADAGVTPYAVPVAAATVTIIGHSRSLFLGFKGGKSAATGLGTLLGFSLAAGGLTFAVWLIVLYLSRIVSLASLSAAVACPIVFYLLKLPPAFVVYSVIGFLYVTIRHTTNIKRLLRGEEPKIGQKAKGPQITESAKSKEA